MITWHEYLRAKIHLDVLIHERGRAYCIAWRDYWGPEGFYLRLSV